MQGTLTIHTIAGVHHVPCRVDGAPPRGRFELVFTTALSAYVESCTDPSYAGQALALAHPVVGAHGMPSSAMQSTHVQPAIVIASSPTPSFVRWIVESGGCIATCTDVRSMVALARDGADVNVDGHDGARVTPTPQPSLAPDGAAGDVLIVDFGCKLSIVQQLHRRGLSTRAVDPTAALGLINAGDYTAILLSNGPGDPRRDALGTTVAAAAISTGAPTLGICYGHQLLAIADGMRIIPLACGHRGTNHPVTNIMTGCTSVTSHNHGFTVSEPCTNAVAVTYRSALDGTVEGIARLGYSGVQFHPEGAPGPQLDEVMDSFTKAVNGARRST
jgi:carbamoyl-phosphate synthase small subunit